MQVFNALQKGMNFDKFLAIVKKIRKETDIPLVLMTYTNILYRHGYEKFISTVKSAGIDGLILPDMSIDESKDFLQAAKKIQDGYHIFNLSKYFSREN